MCGQLQFNKDKHTSFFQFQTVPTANPYGMMKATLSSCSMLGSNWEDIAYDSFRNIANTQTFIAEEFNNAFNFHVYFAASATSFVLLGVALLEAQMTLDESVVKDAYNDQVVTEKATDTVRDSIPPTPSNMHNVLLVDANGADKQTEFVFQCRNMYVYPDVKFSEKLVGKNEAIKEKFISKLKDSNLKLISVGGHGNNDRVYGYVALPNSHPMPILFTNDVTKELATGKIFHIVACNTANDLGPALVSNGAIAFIGYNKPFRIIPESQYKRMFKPDCTIVQQLIKGKTVNQAVQNAKAEYKRLMNTDSTFSLIALGALEHNCDALVVLGNDNATLLQPSNQDEQQQSTSQDEQQKSTSHHEHQKSTIEDEQQKSISPDEQLKCLSQDEQQRSTSQDQHQQSTSQDEQQKSTSHNEHQKSTSEDEQQKSISQDEQQKSTSQDEQQKSTSQDEQHSGKHNQALSQHQSRNWHNCSII